MHKLSIIVLLASLCFGCNSSKSNQQAWLVNSQQNQLATQLYPAKQHDKNTPIVIFIHGDGAANKDSHGFYKPIFNSLNQQGISAVSWHKPGVEDSTGNWLNQTMLDRAVEVEDVAMHLRQQGYQGKIGVLGFSQAGWVLPYIDNQHIDFAALVSPAINWQQQSAYLMYIRLVTAGVIDENDEAAITEIQDLIAEESQLISLGYQSYIESDIHQHPYMPEPITDKERFHFVSLNVDEDASFGLSQLSVPLLVVMGEHDTNVDIENTQATLKNLPYADQADRLQYQVLNDANHQLLDAETFEGVTGFDWYVKFEKLQEKAFVPEALPLLTTWLATNSK